MKIKHVEPWPSTYKQLKEKAEPRKLVANFKERGVGAMRVAIPPLTAEPPQIHLIAQRDGKPFQELLIDLDKSLLVQYFNPKTGLYEFRTYFPGEDIIIPEYKIHWLINPHEEEVSFTCEYAPFPWEGDNDEPEFPNLGSLLEFVCKKGLMRKLLEHN